MTSIGGSSSGEDILLVSLGRSEPGGRADRKDSDVSWASAKPVFFHPFTQAWRSPAPQSPRPPRTNQPHPRLPSLLLAWIMQFQYQLQFSSQTAVCLVSHYLLILAVWHIARMESTAVLTQASTLLKYGGGAPFCCCCFRWAVQVAGRAKGLNKMQSYRAVMLKKQIKNLWGMKLADETTLMFQGMCLKIQTFRPRRISF